MDQLPATNRPIWFLDIDGVVNALSDGIPLGYRRTTANTMGRGWRIVYSPEVIDFVNASNRDGLAEVRWLTTWEQDAHLELAPEVGLDTFPAYDIPDDESALGWWKADIVGAAIGNEGRPILWTDDDIESEVDEVSAFAGASSLLISPNPRSGLVRDDLNQIREFLKRFRENASADQSPSPAGGA